MASIVLCRLCWGNASSKKVANLFSRKSLDQGWASRITALLDVPVSREDSLPPYVCSKCLTRLQALERAAIDLAAFKRSAKSCIEQSHRTLKRTKETSGEVGVSPNTRRNRPHSKVARRLQFASKWIITYRPTYKHTNNGSHVGSTNESPLREVQRESENHRETSESLSGPEEAVREFDCTVSRTATPPTDPTISLLPATDPATSSLPATDPATPPTDVTSTVPSSPLHFCSTGLHNVTYYPPYHSAHVYTYMQMSMRHLKGRVWL